MNGLLVLHIIFSVHLCFLQSRNHNLLEKMYNVYDESNEIFTREKNCSELEEFDFMYYAYRIESIWCIVISIIGTTGNLLTLFAIPFAARNKLYVKCTILKLIILEETKTLPFLARVA